MALLLAVIAASCSTRGMALASKPWGGGQSASKPPRELLGRGAYAHFETIPTRWNDMDAQQHVWFSVSMRAIAAMAYRPTRLRRRPALSMRRLYAQVLGGLLRLPLGGSALRGHVRHVF